MEGWLSELAAYVGLAIEFVAIVVVAIGTIEALIGLLPLLIRPGAKDERRICGSTTRAGSWRA